jgi:hypothetical protein
MYRTCCLYGLGRNDFDAGKSITQARALKIDTFFGSEMATSEAPLQGTPSNGPRNGFARIKIIKSNRHILKPVLRVRDVYPDPGSDFFLSRIPDPNCLHPGSRILIKEFKNFNPKKIQKMVSKLLKI